MSGPTIWYFIKLFEKEEYADQFIKGTLYLNRLSYFQQLENSCADGRSDTTEAVAIWLQPHDFIMELNIPGVGSTTISKDDLDGPVSMSYSDYNNLHVLCLYAVYTTGFAKIDGKLELAESEAAELQRQVTIDDRCLKFGPFAVIIPAVPLLSQVKKALQRRGQWFEGKLVEYYDDETFHGEIAPKDIPFKKQKRFSYQNEFRICVQTKTSGSDPLLIDIGDYKPYYLRKGLLITT
jgi:hypothetical protein